MQLKEFLDKTAMPVRELARRCDVTTNTIYTILHGRNTSLAVAVQIYEATDGQVTPNDLAMALAVGPLRALRPQTARRAK